MARQLRLSLLALSFVLGITAKAAAQDPTFIAIQPPDGNGSATIVFDINDRGAMVGAYNSDDNPNFRGGHRYGFLRSQDGTFTRIDFPGSFRTHADGINPRGDIVGWYARVMGEIHGYLRTKEGEYISFDVPGAGDTRAVGINRRGDIVGFYCAVTCNVNRIAHGFLLHEGEFTTIDVPGALSTEAWKINRRGQILGRYIDPEGKSHLVLLREGEFTTIDVPGAFETGVGGTNGGLNSRGNVVGDYCDAAPCPVSLPETVHGFLLREGEFTTIDVPGALYTSAFGINSRGDIVGSFNVDSSNSVGFLLSRGDEDEAADDDDARAER